MSSIAFELLTPFGARVTAWEDSPRGWSDLRELALRESLVILPGVAPLTESELLERVRRLSFRDGSLREQILHWDFGPVMTMAFDPEAENYLFSAEAVPFHWDGAFHREPQFLVFACEESEGDGGETLFTSTEKLWGGLSAADRTAMAGVRLSYRTEKKAHYGGEIDVPLSRRHPLKQTPILRFAEEVETSLNPVSMRARSESGRADEVVDFLRRRVYDGDVCYTHRWRAGDVVIADNFSLIHGRRALGDNRRRRFKRIQIL